MARDTTPSTDSSAVERVGSPFDTQRPTIPRTDDSLSISASYEHNTNHASASPTLEDIRNARNDYIHNDEHSNEMRNIILPTSDDSGGNQPISDHEPAVQQLDHNVRLKDGVRYTTVPIPIGNPLSPLLVISPCSASSPSIAEQPQPVIIMDHEPDPRLLDALCKPLDRLLILKIEQEVIALITGALDTYDTPPLNSYHRMLVHKIAEFYRLTHIVSPDAMDSVRLFRGHASRMPPVKLGDIASPKSPSSTPPSATKLTTVKIMRRRSPCQQGHGGELDQPGDGRGGGGSQANDLSKLMTREEKEMAYQLARARIFGDFKEPPPQNPGPSKSVGEVQMLQHSNREQGDGFQSRSQYPYCVVTQTFPNLANKLSSNLWAVPGFSRPAQSHTLNPAAISFSPNSGAFTPGPMPEPVQPTLSQPYPVAFTHEGGYPVYPPVQLSNMLFHVAQPNLDRPVISSSANNFTSPITPLPHDAQSSHRNAALGGSLRLPSADPGFVLTATDSSRGDPQFGPITDPHTHTGSDIPSTPNFPYFGHLNRNLNGTINGRQNSGMDGGGALVSASSIQQPGRSEGPGHPGNFRPYGPGRG